MIPMLLSRLLRAEAAAPVRATVAQVPAEDDDLPRGCGWFESSHELQQGLLVTEHAEPDAVAAALPLDDWIALHLACRRAVA